MQKKLMAVAVASAVAAPGLVLAQTSTVQIGGGITAFYYQHTPHNPSVAKRGDIMESSEPEFFIRGEEQLGGGLSAWFQCTSSMDGIISGNNAVASSGICARNSGIGFKGGFGNVFWGNWDVGHKLFVNRIRGWNGGTNAFTGGVGNLLMGGSASGTVNPMTTIGASPVIGGATGAATVTSDNPASFFRRQANSWHYHSPSFAGFQVQGDISADNESTGIPEAMGLRPRMWSVGVHYDNGPLYIGGGYERHKDYNASNQSVGATGYTGGSDHSWTVGAGYTFAGVFKITGMYMANKYEVNAATDMKVRGFAFFADWAIAGPHSIKAQYIQLRDIKGSSSRTVGAYRGPTASSCLAPGGASTGSCGTDTGAKQFGAWYAYAFSKRTELFAGFNRVDNDRLAVMSLGKTAPTAGATQTNIGMGVRHRF
jgi:predicted porin